MYCWPGLAASSWSLIVVTGSSAEGRRVILLARADLDAATKVIRSLEPAALVVLHEAIKPGAAETVRLLLQQGITIKLLSGRSSGHRGCDRGQGRPEHIG